APCCVSSHSRRPIWCQAAPRLQRHEADACTVQTHRRTNPRKQPVPHRELAAWTAVLVRSRLLRLPPFRVDRRERRLLCESAEEERKSADRGRTAEMARPRHFLDWELSSRSSLETH